MLAGLRAVASDFQSGSPAPPWYAEGSVLARFALLWGIKRREVRMRKLSAEFLGTLCLVFAGTGAIVINDGRGGVIGHGGIALAFGLIVLAMIYTFGDVSGAHLNPAVTTAFAAAKRFP